MSQGNDGSVLRGQSLSMKDVPWFAVIVVARKLETSNFVAGVELSGKVISRMQFVRSISTAFICTFSDRNTCIPLSCDDILDHLDEPSLHFFLPFGNSWGICGGRGVLLSSNYWLLLSWWLLALGIFLTSQWLLFCREDEAVVWGED